MPIAPEVRIVKVEHGVSAAAAALNRKFAPDSALLRATVDIVWDEVEPLWAISRLEKVLLCFSPTFSRHECRGDEAYHVFLGGDPGDPGTAPASSGSASQRLGPPGPSGPGPSAHAAAGETEETLASVAVPFDGCLALAHLIEHSVIDFQCAITDQKRCSGVTAAYRRPQGRFDIIFESPVRRLGMSCLALAAEWLPSALAGKPLGAPERAILAAARFLYGHPGKTLTAPELAKALCWSARAAEKTMSALGEVGYLDVTPCSFNFSGIPEYLLSFE